MFCKGSNATSLPAVIPEGRLCLEHILSFNLQPAESNHGAAEWCFAWK